MESRSEEQVSPERMLEFAAYLRDTPEAVDSSAQELSKRFSVPVEIVQESLAVARLTRHRTNQRAEAGESQAWASFSAFFSRLPELSAVLMLPISVVCGTLIGYGLWTAARFGSKGPLLTAAIVIVLGLSGLAFASFNKARIRFAVAGAVLASICVSLFRFFSAPSALGADTAAQVVTVIAQIVVFSVIGGAFMVASSIVGGLYRIRQEEKAEIQLDRLQLLQRIFRLQERLENGHVTAQRRVRIVDWLRSVGDYWILTSLATGVTLSLVELAAVSLVGTIRVTGPQGWQSLFVMLILFAITLISYGLCGFLAGNWLRGIVSGLIIMATGIVTSLLPIAGWGISNFVQNYKNDGPSFWLGGMMLVGLAMFGGIGATVDRRLQHKRRVLEADRAALLSEIVRYQQLLATGATEVCVVAVDCVGSTKMKRGADPLAVEISFRQLHEFIERIVLRHGGFVKSQVGDMAIAEFQCVADGYAAARTIQSQIVEFNTASNKLPIPFRVRVGIHCGHILGTIEEVQFSRVIDVAAHLEKVAPAGGIALSDDAAASLDSEQFIELANEVDGHKVFLSTDPTS